MNLFKDDNGQIVQTIEAEEITREEIESMLAEAQRAAAMLAEALAQFDALSTPAEQPAAPEQVVEQTQPQIPAEAPVAVELPAALPVELQPAPAETVAEQPSADIAPIPLQ